jgi:hypothetical protein
MQAGIKVEYIFGSTGTGVRSCRTDFPIKKGCRMNNVLYLRLSVDLTTSKFKKHYGDI